MEKSFNLIINGVGGQGILLLSNIIGNACAPIEKRIITQELHGLAQRSGPVITHVRIGEEIYSPRVPIGGADVILSTEAIESLRNIELLKPKTPRGESKGTVILNSRIVPPPISTLEMTKDKEKKYIELDEIIGYLKEWTENIIIVNALELALEAGATITENIVMLGALTALPEFPLEKELIEQSLVKTVPQKAIEVNKKAFQLGFDFVKKKL
ncbi:MAG: indolepyruvate oxidoreductase subunit beta [Candidatus Helarchaeota archaeon]|nr:indolepyruvate oxidoreductase subunit beta [Candidatus Helarchaeota archaeon]